MSIHNRQITKDPSSRRWIVPALLLVAALSLAGALLVVPANAHGARDPKAPSGLAAALVQGVVTLTWSAPAEDAVSVTGYQVLRRRPGVDAVGIFHIVEERIGVARNYADRTANVPGGKYTYRVKAWRCEDLSAWSNYSRIDLAASFTAPETGTQDPTVTPDPSTDCATANADCDCDSHRDGDSHADRDGDCYSHRDGDSHADRDGNGHAHSDGDCYAHRDGHVHTHIRTCTGT